MFTDYTELIPSMEYFVERRCAPTWSIKKGRLPYHDLTYVIAGKSTYFIHDVPFHLQQGDMIYIPKGSYRQAFTSPDTPMHCYAFNFHCSLNNRECVQLPFPSIFTIHADPELMRLFKDFAGLWLEKRQGYTLKARAVFMLILHKLLYSYSSDNPTVTDPRIQKANEYILNHYDQKIDMEHLARMSELHPVYFGSLFREANGCTVKEYITNIRINNAENLLLTGGYSVSEAAERCGFNDIFYFSRVFKKRKGYPPSAARKDP